MTSPHGSATEQALRRARLYWTQSEADLKEAGRRLKARAYVESSYLSLQAALNALASVCFLNGRYQIPNHSTAQMIGQCEEVDSRFAVLAEACEALEAAQHESPFDRERESDAAKDRSRANYTHSDAIVKEVRRYLKHQGQGVLTR